jgi:hypothetical protein
VALPALPAHLPIRLLTCPPWLPCLVPPLPNPVQDHWMRDDEVSKGRECICPEVNRNRNIGEVRAQACMCV